MKTTKVLKAVSLLLILVIAVSCRSGRSTTGKQPAHPTKTETVYVDGGNLPPGQAKKIYGDKSAKAYAPGQRKKHVNRYPLVIIYTPAIVISRHSDGRYYYRNSAKYIYWKGNDGRYYLDEKHLKGIQYEESEYDDWKLKGQKDNKAQEPKGKEQEEKVKEDPKTKDAEHIAKDKDQPDQKAKDKQQKGKDQPDQKAKDENSQKGKAKSKDKT